MAPRRLWLVALALAPLLAGCGGGPGGSADPGTSASPTPSTAPVIATPSPAAAATGIKVAGTGYAFRAPARWRDVSKQVSARGVDTAVAAARATAGFTSNINVVISNESFAADQVEQFTENARVQVDGTTSDSVVEQPTRVAGAVAGHLRGMHNSGKTSYWLEQYLISHGTHTYVVSFSFSPKVPAAKRNHQVASVLASWSWA